MEETSRRVYHFLVLRYMACGESTFQLETTFDSLGINAVSPFLYTRTEVNFCIYRFPFDIYRFKIDQ